MENFDFKKKFGQNFITDKNLIEKIVSYGNISKNDLVIEVGPGMGALTTYLVDKAKYVLIYEIDKSLESILNEKLYSYDNYSLIIKDFLNVDVKKEIDKYSYDKLIFVSNLPYYITTPIIKKFIESSVFLDRMVVMVQEEVANRFSAKTGSREYGSLTVYLNAYYDVSKVMRVNRNLFYPKPNVDSAVVLLNKKENINIIDHDYFQKLVRDSFQFKRKNLRNNLKSYDLEKISNILSKYNLSLNNRAEDIGVDIFIEIANDLVQSR